MSNLSLLRSSYSLHDVVCSYYTYGYLPKPETRRLIVKPHIHSPCQRFVLKLRITTSTLGLPNNGHQNISLSLAYSSWTPTCTTHTATLAISVSETTSNFTLPPFILSTSHAPSLFQVTVPRIMFQSLLARTSSLGDRESKNQLRPLLPYLIRVRRRGHLTFELTFCSMNPRWSDYLWDDSRLQSLSFRHQVLIVALPLELRL